MSLSRHREALSAFEQNDPLAGLHSKITAFKKKQTITSRANDGCYDWITLQRKLKDDETKVTGQLIKASSNLLQLFHEEKEFKCSNTWSEKGNVDPDVNRFDAIKLIQDIISSLQVSDSQKDDDICISQVRSFNGTKKEQHALLLDLRQRLDESLEELDSLYSTLSDETAEHRRGVLLLIRDDQSTASVQHTLPQSLLDGLDSLRGLLQESHCAEDGGEVIDLLEKNLMKSLSDATSKHDSNLEQIALSNKDEPQGWDEKSQLIFKKALSSSGNGTSASNKLLLKRLRRDLLGKEEKEIVEYLNYERQKKINKIKVDAVTQDFNGKCQLIESNGLKEIQRLRNQFTSTSERKRVQDDNELKRKEMSLRVKAMRMEKEAKKVENEIQAQAMAKKTGEDNDKELQRIQRLIEAKRTILKHQTKQMEDSMETRTNEFQNDFISELKGLQQQQMNRERSKFRQGKLISKEVAKQEACQQAARLEEKRLAKLSNLAASVPYYQSIMDTTSDIHKTTKSRENDVYGGRSKLADFQSGNLKSFTNDKLFSDKNWRLGNALHEAGVANSTYARDIVRAQIPRVEARTTGIKPY